ncbi:MAG: DUF1134 domain-containing protein [Sphingomonadaceae bacterium]|nr:DUF1134 domain-containing protein [Sphingomonadaceae bacterium]
MANKLLISIAAAIGALSLAAAPAAAQIDSVDPDLAMQTQSGAPVSDSDYSGSGTTTDSGDFDSEPTYESDSTIASDPTYIPPDTPGNESMTGATGADSGAATAASGPPAVPSDPSSTYQQDDLIAAAGGVFGDGAEGIARMIERILSEQGEPNGYIVGREAGGAFIFGLRYGSGTLFHRVEGEQPVYWTGPSIGFDVGANGASTFVLVYNLYDTEELFRRFPAVEGDAYFIGGLTASYLRSGDKVLIPIRLGAGLRLGANIGYMNFSRNRRWLPF